MSRADPQQAVLALAGFLRRRLADVGGTLAPLWRVSVGDATEHSEPGELPMAIVTAGAPFAATSYARARLLRQLQASGLLSERAVDSADDATEPVERLELAQ